MKFDSFTWKHTTIAAYDQKDVVVVVLKVPVAAFLFNAITSEEARDNIIERLYEEDDDFTGFLESEEWEIHKERREQYIRDLIMAQPIPSNETIVKALLRYYFANRFRILNPAQASVFLSINPPPNSNELLFSTHLDIERAKGLLSEEQWNLLRLSYEGGYSTYDLPDINGLSQTKNKRELQRIREILIRHLIDTCKWPQAYGSTCPTNGHTMGSD